MLGISGAREGAGKENTLNRQVTCITKRDRPSPHERIEAIGGTGWKH